MIRYKVRMDRKTCPKVESIWMIIDSSNNHRLLLIDLWASAVSRLAMHELIASSVRALSLLLHASPLQAVLWPLTWRVIDTSISEIYTHYWPVALLNYGLQLLVEKS